MKMLIALTLLAVSSISLFEAAVVLLIPFILYHRAILKGKMVLPLILHFFTTTVSTLLYTPSQIGKAIERSLFLLVYPLGATIKLGEKDLYRYNLFLTLLGTAFLPVVLYNFYQTGQVRMLWGGWFEVGAFYTLFALSALSLTLYKRHLLYLLPFLIFSATVFLSMRRSAILGLLFSFFAFLFIFRGRLPRAYTVLTLFSLTLITVIGVAVFLQIDPRYKAVKEVVLDQRTLDRETMNTISSLRWQIAEAGIQVIKKDIKEGNWLPLLIGHGTNSGFYLEPKSPVGGIYESFILLSEFIEKGLMGVLAIAWICLSYFRFLLRFKFSENRDYLLMPLMLMLGAHLVGALFTFFWDAMLPLYLILFGVVERLKTSPPSYEPSQLAP
ncbi:MAG: hypothetical protein D6674_04420 [Acidobacteria bacterium]|nr:MAG: hypothetical protein D6674_04420 [Acidobacteriota bacterium]